MRTFWATLICGSLMTSTAFGAPRAQERNLRNAPPARETQIQEIQRAIADLYLSNFKNQVELTDDQFLQLSPAIRQFIQMRFRAANRREGLNRRLQELLAQQDPSEADLEQITTERTQFDREMGTMETRFIERLRATLSTRQIAMVYAFNTKFFEENLPRLLDRARAAAAGPRGQRQAPRQNPNRGRDPSRPGNAFETR